MSDAGARWLAAFAAAARCGRAALARERWRLEEALRCGSLARGSLSAGERDELCRLLGPQPPDDLARLLDCATLPAPALGPGETYVLLALDAWRGSAVRLQLRLDEHGHCLPREIMAEARDEARRVFQALTQFLERLDPPRFPPASWDGGHSGRWTDGLGATSAVDGASLGAPSAVAMLSAWLGRPPRPEAATTGTISSRDGAIGPVTGVALKAEALRSRYPDVRRLVVPTANVAEAREHFPGGEVVGVATLAELLAASELTPAAGELPPRSGEQVRRAFRDVCEEFDRNAADASWVALAGRLGLLARELDQSSPAEAADARILRRLALVHAGERVDDLPEAADPAWPPALRAYHGVSRAAEELDNKRFDLALSLLDAVPPEHEWRHIDLLGFAHGTRGRVLLHSGHPDEALPWLERGAAAHHSPELRVRRHRAQSLVYVATAQRALDQVDAALKTLAEAEDESERWTARYSVESHRGNLVYIRLERGRTLLEVGRAAAALEQLEPVLETVRTAGGPWPRLPIVRALAEAHRRLFRPVDDLLAEPRAVVEQQQTRGSFNGWYAALVLVDQALALLRDGDPRAREVARAALSCPQRDHDGKVVQWIAAAHEQARAAVEALGESPPRRDEAIRCLLALRALETY